MEPKRHKALKLIEGGASVAEAARDVGISRQAVYAAMKTVVREEKREPRLCSECGQRLPETVRSVAKTCSGKCRVARMRRLKAEAGQEKAKAIAAERARLGLPAVPGNR